MNIQILDGAKKWKEIAPVYSVLEINHKKRKNKWVITFLFVFSLDRCCIASIPLT